LKKILITTGGSGGHVIPALNLFDHLKNEFDVTLYTDVRGAKFIPKETKKIIFEVKQIAEKKYLLPFKLTILFFAFVKSLIRLSGRKFDIIISTGGYMSLPIVLAAKVFNIKIFLFEPNSIIGRSNKFLLKFCDKIFCYDKNLQGFNKKFNNKVVNIPPILNKCFYQNSDKEKEFDNRVFKILIIGGSQASLFFSKNLQSEMIKIGKKYKITIVQQLSINFNINDYKRSYDENNIENELFYFKEKFLCDDNNFDIAISRSGASSLTELAHLNIPFIAIPFPYATDNHQYFNAKRYYEQNCCWLLEEKKINSGDIFKIINEIMENKKDYFEKKKNLKKVNANLTWESINKMITENFNEY
tara:strand:- start:5093 stop:6166 length:1074 start_codon:yes stop_codon:yes gene_type:complete